MNVFLLWRGETEEGGGGGGVSHINSNPADIPIWDVWDGCLQGFCEHPANLVPACINNPSLLSMRQHNKICSNPALTLGTCIVQHGACQEGFFSDLTQRFLTPARLLVSRQSNRGCHSHLQHHGDHHVLYMPCITSIDGHENRCCLLSPCTLAKKREEF